LGFCLFCVWGTPPLVDLPAHGAQLQLMKDWLAGDEATRAHFSLHFVAGYGLWYWLALPLAALVDGAWAARAVVFLVLALTPASLEFWFKQVGQQRWVTVLALPLCFTVSYWYGFVSTLVTFPAIFLGLGLWERWRRDGARADRLGTLGCLLFCALDHPVSWVALGSALLGAELLRPQRSFRALAPLLATGLVLVPYGLAWLQRAPAASGPPLAWRFDTHTPQWFWKNTLGESLLGFVWPLGLTVFGLLRCRSRVALGAAVGVLALYALVPYTGGGAMMLDIRLPGLVALLALGGARLEPLARSLKVALVFTALAGLGEVGWAHHRFRAYVEPAQALFLGTRVDHTTVNEVSKPPFSKHPSLEHFFAWETAHFGGLSDAIFADATHVPMQRRSEVPPPPSPVRYGFGPPRELPGCVREAGTKEVSRWRCAASPDAGAP
jgi:hypothetical protein